MKNYVRLVEGTEHVETKFFDDANREETLQVVTGLLGKAAIIGKKAMVFAWDRDSLPQSLAAQVYRIGRWVCHTCHKEADRCRCKSHAVKPRLQVVKSSEALN
jgi:hypothetical protein